jgi:hypothetical protein
LRSAAILDQDLDGGAGGEVNAAVAFSAAMSRISLHRTYTSGPGP